MRELSWLAYVKIFFIYVFNKSHITQYFCQVSSNFSNLFLPTKQSLLKRFMYLRVFKLWAFATHYLVQDRQIYVEEEMTQAAKLYLALSLMHKFLSGFVWLCGLWTHECLHLFLRAWQKVFKLVAVYLYVEACITEWRCKLFLLSLLIY